MRKSDIINISFIYRLFRYCLLFSVSQSLTCCEKTERYYRPDLPEQLCSIGIIDIDDTNIYNQAPRNSDYRKGTRFVSFEKSFQIEYADEVNDSLRDFTFSISSEESELFSYTSDTVIKNLPGFDIPGDIEFHSGLRYFLHASERDLPPISAEVRVPPLPPIPELISVTRERVELNDYNPCTHLTSAKSAVIEFSFENQPDEGYYYTLLLAGQVHSTSSYWPVDHSLLEYDVRYCNTPGFFAVLHGLDRLQWVCSDSTLLMQEVPFNAYFIDGSKVPDNQCILTISTRFEDDKAPFEFLRSLKIRLLSIPEELYQFEKALYTFEQTADDPFTEPIYLNGNIIGGNGVFAVCRSQELEVPFSPWYR
jgi:hypothetical protein